MALAKPLKITSGTTREFASDDYVQNMAVGGAIPPGQSVSYPATYVSSGQQLAPAHYHVANAYFNGSTWKRISTGRATTLNVGSGVMEFYNSASGAADADITFIKQLTLKETGELIANPSYINVKAYGALGDGSADDTAEIQAAINDAVSLGMRCVYFPQGVYVVSSELSVSGDMTLYGDGSSTSILKVTGIGIRFAGVLGALENEKLTVMRLGFRAGSASSVAAIIARWSVPLSGLVAAVPACLIYDVEVGAAGATYGFDYGLILDAAHHGVVEKFSFYGITNGTVPGGTTGIVIGYGTYYGDWVTSTAYAADSRLRVSDVVYRCATAHTSGTFATDLAAGKWIPASTTDFKIRDCTIHYADYGVSLQDCEGVYFTQNTFLSCNYGIAASAFSAGGKPYLNITGNHFNVGTIGVSVYGMVQFFIGDNLIYGNASVPLAGTNFYGVYIESTPLSAGVEVQSFVRNNIVAVVNDSYTTARGYHITGKSGVYESVTFSGNRSQVCDTLIYLDSNTSKVVVTADNIGTSGETWSDNGSGNSLPYGKYSPTGVTGTNCTTANVYGDVLWERTGNVVTAIGQIDAAPTSSASPYQFFIPLPVASALTSATQLSGLLSPSGANAPGGAFVADTTNDRAECNVYSPSTGATRYSFMFRYPVV